MQSSSIVHQTFRTIDAFGFICFLFNVPKQICFERNAKRALSPMNASNQRRVSDSVQLEMQKKFELPVASSCSSVVEKVIPSFNGDDIAQNGEDWDSKYVINIDAAIRDMENGSDDNNLVSQSILRTILVFFDNRPPSIEELEVEKREQLERRVILFCFLINIHASTVPSKPLM